MTEHVDLTDPELHEPKGAAAASANTVYVADGAGSGTWQTVDVSVLDYTALLAALQADIDDGDLELTGKYFIRVTIPDISTASSVLIPVRIASTFVGATSVLGGAITVADANIAFTNSAGSSMGTAMVVAFSGSAKGDVDTFTATSNNTISANGWMEVATDGASTTAATLDLILEFTGILN